MVENAEDRFSRDMVHFILDVHYLVFDIHCILKMNIEIHPGPLGQSNGPSDWYSGGYLFDPQYSKIFHKELLVMK